MPPGQLHMFPLAPSTPRSPYRVVGPSGECHGPIPVLSMAAAVADTVATTSGEAWIVARDTSTCHVTAAGAVTPSTGWAAVADLVISRRRTP